MTTNTFASLAATTTTTSAQAELLAKPVTGVAAFAHLFKRGDSVAANDAHGETKSLSKSAQAAMTKGRELLNLYATYKADYFDRSDKARWDLLGKVYAEICTIEKSSNKRDMRGGLITLVYERTGHKVSSGLSTEAIYARLVFESESAQTRSNYAAVFVKAKALDVSADGLAEFLAKEGGYAKFLEKDFETAEGTAAQEVAMAAKADQKDRTQLVRRLYAALAHDKNAADLHYEGTVTDWVPEQKVKTGDSGEKKQDDKYERGDFVFFVSLRDAESNTYKLVQGNIFDKAFEDSLLKKISTSMGVQTEELQAAVQNLEQAIGFDNVQQSAATVGA